MIYKCDAQIISNDKNYIFIIIILKIINLESIVMIKSKISWKQIFLISRIILYE